MKQRQHADGCILTPVCFTPLKHIYPTKTHFLSHTRETIPTVQKLYCLNVKSTRDEREAKQKKEEHQDETVKQS